MSLAPKSQVTEIANESIVIALMCEIYEIYGFRKRGGRLVARRIASTESIVRRVRQKLGKQRCSTEYQECLNKIEDIRLGTDRLIYVTFRLVSGKSAILRFAKGGDARDTVLYESSYPVAVQGYKLQVVNQQSIREPTQLRGFSATLWMRVGAQGRQELRSKIKIDKSPFRVRRDGDRVIVELKGEDEYFDPLTTNAQLKSYQKALGNVLNRGNVLNGGNDLADFIMKEGNVERFLDYRAISDIKLRNVHQDTRQETPTSLELIIMDYLYGCMKYDGLELDAFLFNHDIPSGLVIHMVKEYAPQSKLALIHFMIPEKVVLEKDATPKDRENPNIMIVEDTAYQMAARRWAGEKIVFARWQGKTFMFYISRSHTHTIEGMLIHQWRYCSGVSMWRGLHLTKTVPENLADLHPALCIMLDEIIYSEHFTAVDSRLKRNRYRRSCGIPPNRNIKLKGDFLIRAKCLESSVGGPTRDDYNLVLNIIGEREYSIAKEMGFRHRTAADSFFCKHVLMAPVFIELLRKNGLLSEGDVKKLVAWPGSAKRLFDELSFLNLPEVVREVKERIAVYMALAELKMEGEPAVFVRLRDKLKGRIRDTLDIDEIMKVQPFAMDGAKIVKTTAIDEIVARFGIAQSVFDEFIDYHLTLLQIKSALGRDVVTPIKREDIPRAVETCFERGVRGESNVERIAEIMAKYITERKQFAIDSDADNIEKLFKIKGLDGLLKDNKTIEDFIRIGLLPDDEREVLLNILRTPELLSLATIGRYPSELSHLFVKDYERYYHDCSGDELRQMFKRLYQKGILQENQWREQFWGYTIARDILDMYYGSGTVRAYTFTHIGDPDRRRYPEQIVYDRFANFELKDEHGRILLSGNNLHIPDEIFGETLENSHLIDSVPALLNWIIRELLWNLKEHAGSGNASLTYEFMMKDGISRRRFSTESPEPIEDFEGILEGQRVRKEIHSGIEGTKGRFLALMREIAMRNDWIEFVVETKGQGYRFSKDKDERYEATHSQTKVTVTIAYTGREGTTAKHASGDIGRSL